MKVKSKVGPKGQVVIPKELREEFNIMPGDEVLFDADEHVIKIYPHRDPKRFVREYVSVVKEKERAPRRIDWDEQYYSQFE
jgi:AbrB family looped-hinge helix DNA binding protein